MKKYFLFLCTVALLAGCKPSTKSDVKNMDANQSFDRFKEQFIENLWQVYPEWASSQGYHKYDSMLIVPDEAYRNRQLTFVSTFLDSLKGYDVSTLSDHNKTDYYMIENQLNATAWSIQEEKSHEWDPSQYNVSNVFATMLHNDYDSIRNRLQHFYQRMAFVPAYYEAAKKNISNPTVEHTKLAIDQNRGGISVFETDLAEALKKSGMSEDEIIPYMTRAKEVVAAINGFASWLESMKNDTPRNFRLGDDLYKKKFGYMIQSGYTVDQVYEKAISHKKHLHAEMARLAKELWPKHMKGIPEPADTLQLIRKMVDKLSLNHVKPDSFQAAIEQQIPALEAFIKEKDLVYLDPSKPLVVRREPDYMAGVAGASITSPGPYDKNGNTYYNVGSLSGWPQEKAESYLREYNHYVLQILNIHEAIPGHYVQLIYSNQSPSLIKSLFGNSTMVEGWAVYTERMMMEAGYGSEDGSGNSSPEMWLMYYKWNLRSTCNTILDYSVHVKNMSKEDAMNLLVNEAFQQQTEAEGKWRRVSVTQVQLCCYFTGYTEIYDFREELKKKMGGSFNLKAFHEKFLSYGSAPVKYIKQLMMAEI